MRFTINSVILWSKKVGVSPRAVPFEDQSVNIITGASRTGKSALIPIIDYCLGSDKCTIPVDIIRNACSWFGVLFDMDGEQLLLCRREPGDKASTGDMFILRDKEITIPGQIEKSNTNITSIKDMLNELFGMSFLELDPDAGVFRPSYRDFMAFLFQPQNIVANADVLFYKADTMEHRKKLIDVFPYALGAVTPETLAKRKEIERLSKISERFQRDLEQIKAVAEGWKQEVAGWLTQAREYGLTNYVTNDADGFTRQVDELRAISQKRITDATVAPGRVTYLSEDLVALRREEQKTSSELFAARKRHTEMLQLMKSMDEYDKSLQIQFDRLDISTWIRSNMTERNVLPIFQSSHENAMDDVNTLCNAVEQIERTTTEMAVVPAAFEREMQIVQVQIQEQAEKLEAIQKRIRAESQALAVNREESYTLESISRFLGRIETAIDTYERIGTDSELQAKLDEMNTRIEQLKRDVNESEIRRKQDYALSYLRAEMGKILAQLDVEHPEDPVEFVIKDLTVRVKNQTGRDDYLWEIGSASNWLSYHISLILALQHFFQTKSSVNVPNFIIFDQPSQVYFPRTRYSPDEAELQLNDDDKNAVRKIFETLSAFVKNAGFDIQIIVTEHADDDVWGDIPDSCIHLVEKWRNNVKLVPVEWLE
ncbi:plasmid-related protein [Dehalococcoides mccartyi]|nr:plasmid-related protein [Dehalococcoides mccartyi]